MPRVVHIGQLLRLKEADYRIQFTETETLHVSDHGFGNPVELQGKFPKLKELELVCWEFWPDNFWEEMHTILGGINLKKLTLDFTQKC